MWPTRREFLQGCAQTRSLTEPELTAARFFVPVRQIWWLGLHMYFRGSGAWGYQEIDGFLDHHIGFIGQCIHHYRLR